MNNHYLFHLKLNLKFIQLNENNSHSFQDIIHTMYYFFTHYYSSKKNISTSISSNLHYNPHPSTPLDLFIFLSITANAFSLYNLIFFSQFVKRNF